MNFKDMLAKMSQLSEATEKTKTGLKHTAEPGGYGRKDDEDEEGNKVKDTSAEKKGRGRPKKTANASGEDKKFDFSAFGATGKDVKLPKWDKNKTTKHSLKEYFDQLDQALLEGETIEKKGGRIHKGSYGTSHEAGDEGVAKVATQRGRGRPKKDADDTGEVKKYDTKTLGNVFGGGKAPSKPIGKVSAKNKIKESEQIQIKPASQVPQKPGQTSLGAKPGQPQQVAGQPAQNTQVIQQGDKTLGTVNNPQLANQIKQSIGKGEMTLMPDESMEEGILDTVKQVGSKVLDKLGHGSDEDLIRDLQRKAGLPQTGKKPEQQVNEKDIGKHNNATTGFDALVKKLTPKYGVEAAKKIAGAQMKKIKEAEMPSDDSDMGAGLGAGRSQGVLEGKKPDFLDVDKDGDKKESFKKAVDDKKKTKVKEGMDQRLKAAHHMGRAHALSKQGYNCGYDDMEEARHYHDGFKQGLDECYGQMPMEGASQEVDDMASFGAHTPEIADEGNAFTGKLAKTPAGSAFSLGGKTFKDTSSIEETGMFESWDNQLGALLEEYKEITEGVSISSSTGNQGTPDSVSINATDDDASKVLAIIKQLGLGGFGGEEQPEMGQSSPMSIAVDGEPETAEIGVVDDHDGMMSLIKKVTGNEQPKGPEQGFSASDDGEEHGQDYEDEEGHGHEHTDEETCNECGMMECGCGPMEEGEETIGGPNDETEEQYMDQAEEEVAEDNAPDSGAADTEAEIADTAQANSSAASYDAAEDKQVTEWANDAGENAKDFDDESFKTDIDFMTKVISGGLNKQKSTGQTTIPVVASQLSRQVSESKMINESVADWKKLAGIK